MDKLITEHIANPLKESKVVGNTISGVALFYPESRNGRVYSEAATQSLLRLAEGIKSNLDHGTSSPRDLLGDITNVYRQGKYIKGNLNLLESARDKDLILDIAANKPHLAGFSINARGKFSRENDENGNEIVLDIIDLYSVDFVGNPATTNGMFESYQHRNRQQMTLEEARRILSGETDFEYQKGSLHELLNK